ncbi:MAG: FemAB family XrtA/PEP-CTERM system-associated protein [Thermoguttaceae bacterium]
MIAQTTIVRRSGRSHGCSPPFQPSHEQHPETLRDIKVEIRPIQTEDYQAWDGYVLAHATPCVYLTTAWKRAVERGYGHQTAYLAAFDDRSLAGVLPLVLIKPPLSRRCLVSLPYCDYGGLVAQSGELASALLARAVDLASQLRATLEIRTAEPSLELERTTDFRQIADKCRMVLGLPPSAGMLWKGFKSKLRSQVRRAMQHGLVNRIGGKELLQDFYTVFSQNMRDLGSPVHSREWLQAVLVAFGDAAKVGVVYKGAYPAAAGIVLTHGSYVTISWASSLREFNSLSPNMLLYWSFLTYAADSGFKFFDFGRSTPGGGTCAFKKQWGAQPSPLFWFRQGGIDAASGEEIGMRLRSIAKGLWTKLPIVVANAAGPRIRKYISK